MPSKKKKYNTRFPPARIKKIMQTDEEIGKVAAAVPVIISRALELFLETLLKTAGNVTTSRNAKTLTTSHVKTCVLADENFHFLKGLVESYPDVQTEEEFSGSFEGTVPAATDSYHISNPSTRGQKPRTPTTSAGPSQSTFDESETWSTEEDDDCSTESCGEAGVSNCEISQVPTSSTSSTHPSCMPGSLVNYNPYRSATTSAEEDYDL